MSFERINQLLQLLEKEEMKKIARKNDTSFTRNRKMNLKEMVLFLFENKEKTLVLELRDYKKDIGKSEKMTKQAISKQRQNLNPEIFKELNKKYVKMLYEEREVKRYKGYIILIVDGTTLELPNNNELKEHYGLQEGQKGSVGRVRAKGLGIYDPLNDIMITSRIDPYEVSEKKQIEDELDNILKLYENDKILLVLDRYYFGISFINKLEKKGFKYVIRMKISAYKKEKNEMKTNDEEVMLKVRTNSVFYAETEEEKQELKKLKEVKTRIIKTKLENGVEEHLSTNLSKAELSEEEGKEIYHGRWKIETAFDVIKNKLKMENFSSYKVIGIEQEFYAQMLLYNMVEDIEKDGGEVTKKNKKKDYQYKINKNVMVGILKEEFIKIFVTDGRKTEEKLKDFLDEVKQYLVEIKPNRSYPRKRMHSMNKYRHNLRRNM